MRTNLIGLDTDCLWGGKLTAASLEDRAVFQDNCPQYQRPDASVEASIHHKPFVLGGAVRPE
jgi:hypothetical protein